MSKKNLTRSRKRELDDNRLAIGTLVKAKKSFGAVPTCGSRQKVRIAEGTTGIVDEGIVKSSIVGVPDFPFITFEGSGGRSVCVATHPGAIATL